MTEQEDRVEISSIKPEEPEDEHEDAQDDSLEKKEHLKTHSKKKPSLKKLQEQCEEQEQLLESAIKERDDYKDKYLRTLAEIDNFRKRVKKEKDEYQKYVLSEFLLDLLQVYDNLERALKAKTPAEKKESVLTLLVSDDEKSIVSGVEMIFKQFSDILKKHNVIEIDALNKPFDPNIHQALSKEEREDITEPLVIEVYQKGFMYNGKLLKASLTKVAVPKKAEKPTPTPDKEDETE